MINITEEELNQIIKEEIINTLNEKDDRCTRIAKRKYDVWPSAYASGAVVKCRQGKIWKGVSENDDVSMNEEYEDILKKEVKDIVSEMLTEQRKLMDVERMVQYIDRIDNPAEYRRLISKLIQHAPKIRNSQMIIKQLYRSLPVIMKSLRESIEEVSFEMLTEKKNLKTGQTLKDQNEQKAAQTQKASQ